MRDMVQFIQSFSCDYNGIDLGDLKTSYPEPQNDPQIHEILSEMDGSLGWIRLDRTDINDVIHEWEFDVGYTMNGRGFKENPFGIVKKLVPSDAVLDNSKMLQWIDLAQHMGYELNVFERRNWVSSGTLVDAGDVLTLPFYGTWKDVAPYYKTLREDFQANIK